MGVFIWYISTTIHCRTFHHTSTTHCEHADVDFSLRYAVFSVEIHSLNSYTIII